MERADLYMEYRRRNPADSITIEEILKEHEKHFQWYDQEVVLDVGCGPGDITRFLLYPWLPEKAQKTVLGIDISPTVIDVGNKDYKNCDVFFETLDVSSQDLSVIFDHDKFRDGFSKIFSFFVLHWIHDIERAFSNMYRLLKPQGQVLLMFPVSRQIQKMHKQIQETEPWTTFLMDVNRDYPNFFLKDPKSEFLSIAHQAGFKVVSCECTPTRSEFADLDAFKNLVGSLDSQISKIPTDQQERYLDECTEILRENKTFDELEDGTVAFFDMRITAFMEK